MIPVTVFVNIVVARDIVIVIAVPHIATRMIVKVRRVVPMLVTTPATKCHPAATPITRLRIVAVVPIAAVRIANIYMHTATTKMKTLCVSFVDTAANKQQRTHCRDGKNVLGHGSVPSNAWL